MVQTFFAPLLMGTNQGPLRNVRIRLDDEGRVLSLNQSDPEPGDQICNGVVVPGWVNTHCHLELSHLQGVFPGAAMGMASFLQSMLRLRNVAELAEREIAMRKADAALYAEGVVAVGDISNTTESLPVKRDSALTYHTFVEILGLDPSRVDTLMDGARKLVKAFSEVNGSSASIAPHAPYSLSDGLFKAVLEEASTQLCSSYHLMESEDELRFFRTTDGPLRTVFESAGLNLSSAVPHANQNPLQEFIRCWNSTRPIQFVHNVYVSEDDLKEAISCIPQSYWCMCPSANLFISGRLPDIPAFRRQGARITIGTDSLASNRKLSVVQELYLIQQAFPEIPFHELIDWATWNGACFLSRQQEMGRVEPDKKPGLVLLTGINVDEPVFSAETTAVRLG
jgi:cytosine/adenosine deaminase-related metal-dependent hydrolase